MMQPLPLSGMATREGHGHDLRSQHTYDDTVQILDRLDIHTEGGLKAIADRIDALETAMKQQSKRS